MAAILLLPEPVAMNGFSGGPPLLLSLIGRGLLRDIVVVEGVDVAVLASLAGGVLLLAEVARDARSLLADHRSLRQDLVTLWGREAR